METNQFDKQAWKNLANSLTETSYNEAKMIFDEIMANFPTSSYFLRLYCELEKTAGYPENVEKVGYRKGVNTSFSRPIYRKASIWTFTSIPVTTTSKNTKTSKAS